MGTTSTSSAPARSSQTTTRPAWVSARAASVRRLRTGPLAGAGAEAGVDVGDGRGREERDHGERGTEGDVVHEKHLVVDHAGDHLDGAAAENERGGERRGRA